MGVARCNLGGLCDLSYRRRPRVLPEQLVYRDQNPVLIRGKSDGPRPVSLYHHMSPTVTKYAPVRFKRQEQNVELFSTNRFSNLELTAGLRPTFPLDLGCTLLSDMRGY